MADQSSTAETLKKLNYGETVRWVKWSQVAIAFLLVLFVVTTPEIRAKVELKPVESLLVNFGFETIMLTLLSWIFGMKKIPANYLSLAFLRFYIFLNQSDHPVPSPQAVEPSEKWYSSLSSWIVPMTIDPLNESQTLHTGCCSRSQEDRLNEERFMFSILVLILTALVTIYSKIDVSRCEKFAITSASIGSSFSTAILFSSMTIGTRISEDCHLILCKIWTLTSFATALFIFIYSTQRMCKRARGKMNSNAKYYRTQLEITIFAICLCATVYFMPTIHPEFSVYETIVTFPYNLMKAILGSLNASINTFVANIAAFGDNE